MAKKLNTPSASFLLPIEHRIRAIQELYANIGSSGSGKISDFENDVKYISAVVPQELSESEKQLARTSIDAAGVESLANYIQKSNTSGLVKNDGTIDTNTYLTQHQDISGKADKNEMSVVNGTGTDADKTTITLKNGTSATVLKSHQDISGKQETLVSGTNIKTINNESVLGSGNINIDISGKEDVTTIVAPVNETDATLPITTLTTEIGKYYRIDVPIETLGVTLPAMSVVTSVKTITIYLTGGTTPAVTIASADNKDVYYQDGYEIKAGKTYEVNALFNGSAWIIASVEVVIPVVEEEGGE